jgi:putative sigma-54 modulation protein
MEVLFESRAVEGAHLRDLAERRARFVLRRLAWLVRHAKVQLSDVNGTHGGVDKRCKVELHTNIPGTVVITSLERDWRAALDSALARASRTMLRAWRRRFDRRRRPSARPIAAIR